MRARAFFLRFGTSIHRGSVVRAYEKFLSLWLEEFEENSMPSVGTLCALVIAHQHLPSKGDVAEAWAIEAEKVLRDTRQWSLPAHEFTDAVHRLGSLPVEKALNLIKMVDEILSLRDFKEIVPPPPPKAPVKAPPPPPKHVTEAIFPGCKAKATAGSLQPLQERGKGESITGAKDVSQPADHGDRLQDDSRKQQSKMRNELIQTMKNIQFERGRADHAAKQTKVIQEATRNCESARAAVRRQLRRGIAKIMQSLHEEEQKLRPLVSMPQLLPSTWHTQLQHEWLREVKPFAELYAYMMFSSRLAPLQDEKDEGGRTVTPKGRKTVGKAEFASKIAADAEAIGRDLISLERKLTPAGVAAEQADLLAEAGLDDLDEPWLEEEQANKQRLASLRSMQQEMFEQARQVAIDLTPES
eukprot:g15395.t1